MNILCFSRISLLVWFCSTFFFYTACAEDSYVEGLDYLAEYKQLAMDEMRRSGVPASIKLAQAMLESNYGKSRLATLGRNHFGIKCKSEWIGDTIRVNDDAPQECFRKYSSVYASYIDHSNFLKYHRTGRYSHLFTIDRTDYKAWAHGLKKAGYATNPRYASLVISLIERYHLYNIDKEVLGQVVTIYTPTKPKDTPNVSAPPDSAAPTTTESATKKVTIITPFELKESYINGVRVVTSNQTLLPTYVANKYNITLHKIYQYNEISMGETFAPNTPVFLAKKKKKSEGKKSVHKVQSNETMYQIAQQYGIRLKNLYKCNKMKAGTQPRKGEKIYLKGKAKNTPRLRG